MKKDEILKMVKINFTETFNNNIQLDGYWNHFIKNDASMYIALKFDDKSEFHMAYFWKRPMRKLADDEKLRQHSFLYGFRSPCELRVILDLL